MRPKNNTAMSQIGKSVRLNVLMSAYACDPRKGSEQGASWAAIKSCALRHKVTVITCESQKGSIEAARAELAGDVNFVYVPGPANVSPSGVEGRFERVSAYLWQLRAGMVVRRLAKQERYDVAQHYSIGTWRMPSCFLLADIPYVLGPLSGAEHVPPSFARSMGWKVRVTAWLRKVLIWFGWCDPLVRMSLNNAAQILVCGPQTHAFLSSHYADKIHSFTRASRRNDLPIWRHGNATVTGRRNSFNIVWVGQLIPRKGLPLLLSALATMNSKAVSVSVVGSGPELDKYKRQALELGINDKVEFLGQLTRKEVFQKISNSDVFVFTSLQDMMGQALSEAMQIGAPCVVLDWSGPSELVGETGGLRIPVTTYEETASKLGHELQALVTDTERKQALGRAAHSRIMCVTDPEILAESRDRCYLEAIRRRSA